MKLSNNTAKLTSIAQTVAPSTTIRKTMLHAVAAATLAAAALAMAPAAHAQRFGVAVRVGGYIAPPAPVVVYNNGYYVGPEPYVPPIIVRGHDDFRYDHDRYVDRRDFNRDRDHHDHDFHR